MEKEKLNNEEELTENDSMSKNKIGRKKVKKGKRKTTSKKVKKSVWDLVTRW